MAIIDLAPLDAEGLRFDRPAHESKWAKLTNVAFRDGSIVPRAGFKEAYGYTHQIVADGAVEPAPANALIEIRNPGSSNTGRSAGAWTGEMLRPDGSSSLVAGWTASVTTLHGDTDEAVPDGAYAGSTTLGSRFSLTFANPVATYSDILGVRIYVRAKVEYSGLNDAVALFRLSQRDGGGNLYTIEDFEVWAFEVDETSFWYDYSFLLEKNYVDGEAWDDGDLDTLQIALEFVSGASGLTYNLAPTSIVSNTGWVDASDAGAAAIADVTIVREGTPVAFPEQSFPHGITSAVASGHGLVADAADDIIEIGFTDVPAGVTFTTINNVEVLFRVKSEPYGPVPYELYYNNGSVDTLILSGVTLGDCKHYSEPLVKTMTVEPVTLIAWTKAQVNTATFKLKIIAAVQLTMEFVTLTVSGQTNSSSARVDTVSAEVLAPGTTNVRDKLVLTNRSFVRLEPESLNVINVTNSVASTSLPSVAPFDWATLYGQAYVVNGVDPTKRYPNAGVLFESLTTNNADGATAITGRTVCAFADRILYGWVKDNATYTPERIAYSRQFNGGTHNHASAGDFDIIDTMGGVVALRPLNESLCFAGKEVGAYALRRTGNSAFPIIVDPIDYETQCLSQYSTQRVLLKGQPMIMFLGANPSAGVNVFAFDGTSVRPVGDGVNPQLEERVNPKMYGLAVGSIDPKTNSYVLFMAEGREIARTLGFAMNLNTLAWTSWELPWSIYSSALWNLQPPTALNTTLGSTNLRDESFPGIPTLVLGGRNNLALAAHSLPYDTLTPPQNAGTLDSDDLPGFLFDTDPRPAQKSVFTSTIETGDFQLVDAQAGELQVASFRVHLDYVNYGPVRIGLSASTDGGLTFTTETIRYIGTMAKNGASMHLLADLESAVNDRKVRIRLRVLPEDSVWEFPFFWQIDRLFIDYSLGGTDGP